jgi:hypothetical protein
MIKSLIILVLLIVACGGAALSCPSQDSFISYYTDRSAASSSGLAATFEKGAYEEYAKSYTYSSKILWATESKNGKVVFTGVFSHWFTRDEAAAKPEATLKSLLK